jgi:hypothetical protein
MPITLKELHEQESILKNKQMKDLTSKIDYSIRNANSNSEHSVSISINYLLSDIEFKILKEQYPGIDIKQRDGSFKYLWITWPGLPLA